MRKLGASASAVAALATLYVACGSEAAPIVSGVDGGPSGDGAPDVAPIDGRVDDAASADVGVLETSDAPIDGADAGCGPELARCTASSGAASLCRASACSACTDMADDAACDGAYGSATGHFICLAGACVAGCRTGATCAASVPACLNNACSKRCDPVSSGAGGLAYVVNPLSGSDASSTTGSGTAGGTANSACAFRTVTAAIDALPASPPAGTTITVVGPSTISTAETFPLTLPANTVLRGAGGTVVLQVPPNTDGIELSAPGSGVAGVSFDGQANTAQHGIVVLSGSTLTTTVTDVTIRDFPHGGIEVRGTGEVTIGGATRVTGSGTTAKPASGLQVLDDGVAVVNGGTLAAPTAFDTNSEHGILVEGNGKVVINATAGTGGAGTVIVKDNKQDGVRIQQSAGGPLNEITGLAVWGSARNGLRVLGGSAVKLRSSYLLNNGASGVLVQTGISDDITRVDLGVVATDWGHNTLQDATSPNGTVGICLAIGAPDALRAAGNVFASNIDCSAAAATLTSDTCVPGSKKHVGVMDQGTISTSLCTP